MASDQYASPAVAHVVDAMTFGEGLTEDQMYLVFRVAFAAAHVGYNDGWTCAMARERAIQRVVAESSSSEGGNRG